MTAWFSWLICIFLFIFNLDIELMMNYGLNSDNIAPWLLSTQQNIIYKPGMMRVFIQM